MPGKQVTIENEQSTINACMKYLFKQGLVHVSAFDFPKLKKIDRNNEEVRRATFTASEYYAVVKYAGFANSRTVITVSPGHTFR